MSEALWTGLAEILHVGTYLLYLHVAFTFDFGCDSDLDSGWDSNLVSDLGFGLVLAYTRGLWLQY